MARPEFTFLKRRESAMGIPRQPFRQFGERGYWNQLERRGLEGSKEGEPMRHISRQDDSRDSLGHERDGPLAVGFGSAPSWTALLSDAEIA